MDEVGQSHVRGGNKETDIVLDGGGHVVGVGHVACQGQGGAAASPAVSTNCGAERAVNIVIAIIKIVIIKKF